MHMLDRPFADDQRQALDQGHAVDLEGRQPQGLGQGEIGVAQDAEGQMKALGHLALVVGVLRAEAEDGGALCPKLALMVAKCAGLRGTAPSTGDCIPPGRQRLPRPTGPRIGVDHRARAGEVAEIDQAARGRRKCYRGHAHARQVVTGAIVLGRREILRQSAEVMEAGRIMHGTGPPVEQLRRATI